MTDHVQEFSGPHYSTVEFDTEEELPAGTLIAEGRFELIGRLARGGMSIVYRARDHQAQGREVAVKVVTAKANTPNTQARYENEARLGASLAGEPRIVRSVAVGALEGPAGFEGRMFLVTELVDGQPLDAVMRANRKGLGEERACAILRSVAQALVGVHERGVIHRDLKPGNVLLVAGENGREEACLIDFGIAYATGDGWAAKSPDLTTDGNAPGTPLYMSPQQAIHDQPSPAFDVYALGVMLYELVSGDPPYEGLPHGHLIARKCDPTSRPFPLVRMVRGTSSRVGDLVDRCMDYEPARRPTAAELVALLEPPEPPRAAVPLHVVPPATSAVDQTEVVARPDTPRRRGAVWIVVAVVILLLAALAIGVWKLRSSSDTATEEPLPSRAVVAAPADVGGAQASDVEPPQHPVEIGPAPGESGAIEPVAPKPAPVEPPPATDDGPAEAPAPTAAPKARPKARVPKQPTPPSCDERRELAAKAQATRDWTEVLQQTKDAACWPSANERSRLRIQALLRLRRYDACMRIKPPPGDSEASAWRLECYEKANPGAENNP